MQTRTGSTHHSPPLAPLRRAGAHDLRALFSAIPSATIVPALHLADIGSRLADLVPLLHVLAGPRIALDAAIAMPNALVRIAREEFDAAILALVASAVAADARNIVVRNRMVGAHAWVLASDDGRGIGPSDLAHARDGLNIDGARGGGLFHAHHFARMAHGRLLIRNGHGSGMAIAIVLPAVLSVAGASSGVPQRRAFFKPQETIHAKDRQRTAA